MIIIITISYHKPHTYNLHKSMQIERLYALYHNNFCLVNTIMTRQLVNYCANYNHVYFKLEAQYNRRAAREHET